MDKKNILKYVFMLAFFFFGLESFDICECVVLKSTLLNPHLSFG